MHPSSTVGDVEEKAFRYYYLIMAKQPGITVTHFGIGDALAMTNSPTILIAVLVRAMDLPVGENWEVAETKRYLGKLGEISTRNKATCSIVLGFQTCE